MDAEKENWELQLSELQKPEPAEELKRPEPKRNGVSPNLSIDPDYEDVRPTPRQKRTPEKKNSAFIKNLSRNEKVIDLELDPVLVGC